MVRRPSTPKLHIKPTMFNKERQSSSSFLYAAHYSSYRSTTSMSGGHDSSRWNEASARPTLPTDAASNVDSMGQAFGDLNLQHPQSCDNGSAAGHALPHTRPTPDYHNHGPCQGSYRAEKSPLDGFVPSEGKSDCVNREEHDTSRSREAFSGLAPP